MGRETTEQLVIRLRFLKGEVRNYESLFSSAKTAFGKEFESLYTEKEPVEQTGTQEEKAPPEEPEIKNDTPEPEAKKDTDHKKDFRSEQKDDTFKKERKSNISSGPLKKLFRKIVSMAHPDRQDPASPIRERFGKQIIFEDATSAANSGDVLGLLSAAEKLGIPLPDLGDQYDESLKLQIEEAEGRLQSIVETYAWQWYTAKDPQMKKRLMEDYAKRTNSTRS